MDRLMPDFESERYDGIESITNLELQQALCDVLRRVFSREGILVLDLIIEKLTHLDEAVIEKEVEEEKIDGSVVPVALVRELVDEYQRYLDNGVSETEALKLVSERNKGIVPGKNVENLIRKQTEMYWDNLRRIRGDVQDVILMKADERRDKNASGLEKEMAKTLAEEQLILEITIEDQIGGVDSHELAQKMFEKVVIPSVLNQSGTVDVQEIMNLARQTKGININPERQKKLVEIVNNTYNASDINIKIDQEADSVVESVLKEVVVKQKEAIRISVVKMVERTVDDRTLNGSVEVKKTVDEIRRIYKSSSGLELDPAINLRVETAIKSINVEVEKWISSRSQEINEYRAEKLKNIIFTKTIQENPDISVDKKVVLKEYGNLVATFYYRRSDIEVHKNEAVDKMLASGCSPEQTANAYSDLKGLYSVLKMKPGDFNSLVYKYKQLKGGLNGINLPVQIRELRIFEGLMTLVSEVPEARNLINFTQKYIRIFDVTNKITGGFLEKVGLKKLGMSIMDSVGGQAMGQFVTNSLEVFAENGVKKGAMTILKGIIGGGVKAGTGAVAAFQAIPVVGQVVLVAAAAFVVLKPVVKVIATFLKGLGIDFDKMKSFFQDNFGNFLGGIFSFGAKTGILIISIPVAFSALTISAIVGPVVIFLFIGMFAYNSLNGNIVSSLVPPVRMGGNQSGEVVPSENGDFSGECSQGQNVVLTRQCDSRWAQSSLPAGCTICKAGCGPTSVSMILQKKSADNTVVNLLKDPLYSAAGCSGTSIGQNAAVLMKYLPSDAITYNSATLSCTPTDIARWICDGKIVLVGASFYTNDGTGGHFFLGVAVDKGQVVSADPYYGTRTPMDGGKTYGHVALDEGMWCLLVDPSKY